MNGKRNVRALGCPEVRERSERYTDGDLPQPMQRRIEQHLAGCSACRQFLNEGAALETLLRPHLAEQPSDDPGNRAEVLARVRAAQRWQPTRRTLIPRSLSKRGWRTAAVMALGLVALVVVAVLRSTQQEAGGRRQEAGGRRQEAGGRRHGLQARDHELQPGDQGTEIRDQGTEIRDRRIPKLRADGELRHEPTRQPANPPTRHRVTPVRVTAAEGEVEFQRAGQRPWQPLPPRAELRAGDGVRTGSRGRATMFLADGGRLVLNHETRLHVHPEGLRLFGGELYAEVRKQEQPLVIATRTARVTVLGTKFNLRVVATKAGERVTLTVTEGLVELRNAQGAVRVPAGTQSVVAVQAPPTDPEAVDVASLIAWATEPGSFPSPESSLQLRVRPAVEGGVFPFDGAPLTFLVEADYGNTPYQPLTLTGTIRNKAGEEMATVEKEMGTERLRYRRRPWSSLFVIPVNIRRSLR